MNLVEEFQKFIDQHVRVTSYRYGDLQSTIFVRQTIEEHYKSVDVEYYTIDEYVPNEKLMYIDKNLKWAHYVSKINVSENENFDFFVEFLKTIK